mmetsp:Transcript_28573/g.48601  ORF Transcript_28573/g.48601 Transcript_28573/m.48601 type:complete len:296 (-) Transcript_28573:47-934(-)
MFIVPVPLGPLLILPVLHPLFITVIISHIVQSKLLLALLHASPLLLHSGLNILTQTSLTIVVPRCPNLHEVLSCLLLPIQVQPSNLLDLCTQQCVLLLLGHVRPHKLQWGFAHHFLLCHAFDQVGPLELHLTQQKPNQLILPHHNVVHLRPFAHLHQFLQGRRVVAKGKGLLQGLSLIIRDEIFLVHFIAQVIHKALQFRDIIAEVIIVFLQQIILRPQCTVLILRHLDLVGSRQLLTVKNAAFSVTHLKPFPGQLQSRLGVPVGAIAGIVADDHAQNDHYYGNHTSRNLCCSGQ